MSDHTSSSSPNGPANLAVPCPYQPADLPDVRLDLIHLWEPGGVLSTVAQLFDGRHAGLGSLSGFDAGALESAELFWVSPDTCTTVRAAAASFPHDTTLDPQFLPAPSGFATFGEPFAGIDADHPNKPVRVDAICWGPVILRSRVSGDQRPGVAITSYQWFPDVGQLLPLGRGDWLYGRALSAQSFPDDQIPADNLASVVEDRALLATLCSLVAHPHLIDTTNAPLARSAKRRSIRAGIDPDRVRVHSLRLHGEAIGRAQPGGSLHSRTHRWIVRGHWRSQPYGPDRSLRRPTWIAGHVKGPDGAPLLDPLRRVTKL